MSHVPERMPSVRWSRVALGVGVGLLVAAGMVTLIGKAAGFGRLTRELDDADPRWLALCAVGQVVFFAGYGNVYRGAVAFEGGPRIPFRLALRLVASSYGAAQIVAVAGAASLGVHYWSMRRLGFERLAGALRVVGFNTLVYLVFGVIGATAAAVGLALGDVPAGMALPWVVIVSACVLAARWFTAPRRVEGWTGQRGGWLRRGLALGIGAAWWVRRAVADPQGRGMAWAATLYWGGNLLSLWAALRAFGVEVSIAAIAVAFATGYVGQLVPLPLIGTSGVDAATTYALTAVGVPLSAALLGVVAYRVFAFWLPLVPSLVLLALLPRTADRLEQEGRAHWAARLVPVT